jgi:hypothetical protein
MYKSVLFEQIFYTLIFFVFRLKYAMLRVWKSFTFIYVYLLSTCYGLFVSYTYVFIPYFFFE